MSKGAKATQTYALKDTSKKYNAAAQYYTDAQVEFAKEKLEDMMYFFGYAQSSTDKRENFTGFYKFDEKTDLKHANNYMKWKESNDNVTEWVSSMTPEVLETFQYQLSDPKKEVALMSWKTNGTACLAMQDWTEEKLYGKSSLGLK